MAGTRAHKIRVSKDFDFRESAVGCLPSFSHSMIGPRSASSACKSLTLLSVILGRKIIRFMLSGSVSSSTRSSSIVHLSISSWGPSLHTVCRMVSKRHQHYCVLDLGNAQSLCQIKPMSQSSGPLSLLVF